MSADLDVQLYSPHEKVTLWHGRLSAAPCEGDRIEFGADSYLVTNVYWFFVSREETTHPHVVVRVAER